MTRSQHMACFHLVGKDLSFNMTYGHQLRPHDFAPDSPCMSDITQVPMARVEMEIKEAHCSWESERECVL